MAAAKTPPRAWIAGRLDELHVHGAVALEGADPEGVHQLRVAVRRIRAALRAASFDDGGGLQAELRWFFGELGPLRDLDVLIDRFHGDTEGFSTAELVAFERLLKGLRAERGVARRRANRALRGERYRRLLETLAETDVTPGTKADGGLLAEVGKPFRKLRKAVAAAGPDPADEVLHELRIRGKKLRYAAELAAPSGGKPVRRLVKAAKRLQDVLGEHHDACVAEQRMRALVAEDPEPGEAPGGAGRSGTAEAFIAGRLVERERLRQAESRAQWYEAYQEVERQAVELLG